MVAKKEALLPISEQKWNMEKGVAESAAVCEGVSHDVKSKTTVPGTVVCPSRGPPGAAPLADLLLCTSLISQPDPTRAPMRFSTLATLATLLGTMTHGVAAQLPQELKITPLSPADYAKQNATKANIMSESTILGGEQVCHQAFENFDIYANDIGNVRQTDIGRCVYDCGLRPECNAYTWTNYNGGTCWMKKIAVPSTNPIIIDVIPGYGSATGFLRRGVDGGCPVFYFRAINYDFPDGDIRNSPSANNLDCFWQCSNERLDANPCFFFAWNQHNGGTCWKKGMTNVRGLTQKMGITAGVLGISYVVTLL